MKHMSLRRNLKAAILIAGTFMTASALAGSQEGGIGMMGGYNGLWLPILLIAIVFGLVLWVGTKKIK